MKFLNVSDQGLTHFNDYPRDHNLILTIAKIIVAGAVAITAMIIGGVWGVIAIAALTLIRMIIQFTEG